MISNNMRRAFAFLTGGRPMRRQRFVLRDMVAGRDVYEYVDYFERHWMAFGAWSLFRCEYPSDAELELPRCKAFKGERMTIGAGKYDAELTEAKRQCGATSAVLIVIDGVRGPGFACQTTLEHLAALPEMLESIAEQIRADRGSIPRDA